MAQTMRRWLHRIVSTRPEMVGALTDAEAALVDAHFADLVDPEGRGIHRLSCQEPVVSWRSVSRT